MSKTEIIDKMAAEVSLPKNKIKEVVDAFVKAINDGLSSNGKVSLSGLGNFSKTVRKARSGRNPKTGEAIQIPEKLGVKFKAASQLTESLK